MKSPWLSLTLLFMIVGITVIFSKYEGFQTTQPSPPTASTTSTVTTATVPTTPTTSLPSRSTVVPQPSLSNSAPFPASNQSPNSIVSLSSIGYDAMSLKQKSDLLKDIQKLVKTELLSSRQTDNLYNNSSSYPTPSIQQGCAYQKQCNQESSSHENEEEEENYRCPKNPNGSCPPVPDLSQYIRKDEIPCWGCNLE